jgi:hypothetical protein
MRIEIYLKFYVTQDYVIIGTLLSHAKAQIK